MWKAVSWLVGAEEERPAAGDPRSGAGADVTAAAAEAQAPAAAALVINPNPGASELHPVHSPAASPSSGRPLPPARRPLDAEAQALYDQLHAVEAQNQMMVQEYNKVLREKDVAHKKALLQKEQEIGWLAGELK